MLIFVTSGLALEVNVLRPAPERHYVWCLQSPFDNKNQRGKATSSPASFARITLVCGTEAYVFRFARTPADPAPTVIKSSVEGFPDIPYTDLEFVREAEDKVYLLDETLCRDSAKLIAPSSRLADELRLAYADWKSKALVDGPPGDDYFRFILEPILDWVNADQ